MAAALGVQPKPTGSREELRAGQKVANFEVLRFLGKGAYGAVYKVTDICGKENAMKVELRKVAPTKKCLKMEVTVLTELNKMNSPFFCQLTVAGRTRDFNFFVMSLVGQSLNDLRSTLLRKRLSLGCGLSVGIQCLEALQLLHNTFYIYRDVKPGNFCLAADNFRQIVLIDFGMCRKYVTESGELRHPRWSAGFRGTIRYASMDSHYGKDNCRKDDLESWLYVLLELLVGRLPWTGHEELTMASFLKQCARHSGLRELFSGAPKELIHVMLYIDGLSFYDPPDYAIIRGYLREAIKLNNLREFPYDWEPVSSQFQKPDQ